MRQPQLSESVLYFDREKTAHHALVIGVFPDASGKADLLYVDEGKKELLCSPDFHLALRREAAVAKEFDSAGNFYSFHDERPEEPRPLPVPAYLSGDPAEQEEKESDDQA